MVVCLVKPVLGLVYLGSVDVLTKKKKKKKKKKKNTGSKIILLSICVLHLKT